MGAQQARPRDGAGNDAGRMFAYRGQDMYFGDHFVMGGEQFPAAEPEGFLFGELAELNYLSRPPGSMARPPPEMKHTTTAVSLFNVHKDTLRLVSAGAGRWQLEFCLDADVACQVAVYFFAKETLGSNGEMRFVSQDQRLNFPPVMFAPGIKLQYRQPEFTVDLSPYGENQLVFDGETSTAYPVVIVITPLRSSTMAPVAMTTALLDSTHAHATIATFEVTAGSDPTANLSIRTLAQKVMINGLAYLLKEIYGIEQKDGTADMDADEDSAECVVCMSDARDTLVLPCRHLCLCNPCAEVLRYQANKCPICRAPFNSLLQFSVARKLAEGEEANPEESDMCPPGYKLVPLSDTLSNADAATDDAADDAAAADEPVAAAAAAASEPAQPEPVAKPAEASRASMADSDDMHYLEVGGADAPLDDDEDP